MRESARRGNSADGASRDLGRVRYVKAGQIRGYGKDGGLDEPSHLRQYRNQREWENGSLFRGRRAAERSLSPGLETGLPEGRRQSIRLRRAREKARIESHRSGAN